MPHFGGLHLGCCAQKKRSVEGPSCCKLVVSGIFSLATTDIRAGVDNKDSCLCDINRRQPLEPHHRNRGMGSGTVISSLHSSFNCGLREGIDSISCAECGVRG